MALSAEDVTAIRSVLETPGAGGAAELRRRFPKLSLTQCDAEDVNETPFAVFDTVELHFIDTSDHCVVLTTDPARATGMILARRKARP